MRIAIGSDHAGFELKEKLKMCLSKMGHEIIDLGAASDSRSDYPDFAKEVAELVSSGNSKVGVLVCGSGIGMCMTANRFKGVRAVVLRDENDAEMSRRHNDANIACVGARVTEEMHALRLIEIFLNTPFDGGRHASRVAKID